VGTYEIAVIGTVILMFMGTVDYIRKAWIRKSDPAPATWILMETMILLSFWMYWASPKKSWSANIGVTGGMLAISAILAGVLAANIRHRSLRLAFDRVQWWCLVAGGGMVVHQESVSFLHLDSGYRSYRLHCDSEAALVGGAEHGAPFSLGCFAGRICLCDLPCLD